MNTYFAYYFLKQKIEKPIKSNQKKKVVNQYG